MNYRFLSFLLFSCVAAWGLSSCETLRELGEEPHVIVKRVYAPGELKADEIEKIALSEVGKREGADINFRSDGVQDREDLYYVSVVARPYRADGRRTVVVNDQGEVVQYLKGNRLPKYEGRPASASPEKKTPLPSLLREAVPAQPKPGETGLKPLIPVLSPDPLFEKE